MEAQARGRGLKARAMRGVHMPAGQETRSVRLRLSERSEKCISEGRRIKVLNRVIKVERKKEETEKRKYLKLQVK